MKASSQTVLWILWTRISWRHWRMAPMSSGLLLLILAIGVAAFFSIRLANLAAVTSFQNFADVITSQSDGLITAPAGTLPETVLPQLRVLLGNTPVNLVPVLEANAVPPRRDDGEPIGARPTYQLLGVDLMSLANLAGQQASGNGWFNASETDSSAQSNSTGEPDNGPGKKSPSVLGNPLAVYISQAMARRENLGNGSAVPVVINEHVVELHLAGIIPENPNQPAVPPRMMIMDLPELQRLTDKAGQIDRVEFVLEDGPNRVAQWAAIREKLEAAGTNAVTPWIVGSPGDRRASAAVMTEAFRLNLTILSLLALLVGLYLVFQGLDGAVVRRRSEIAILRSLGVTARQIQAAWLVEAAVVGLAGGLLGLALGWLGAQLAVQMVGRTVNAIYFASSADSAPFNLPEALVALALSVLASVFAGWRPARVAAITPPAQIAARGGATLYPGSAWLRNPMLALGLMIAGAALTYLPPLRLAGGGRFALASYLAGLCWVFGAGIFAGNILAIIGRAAQKFGADSLPLRLAYSHLRAPSGRHRLAVAGLVCAVGMTSGMAILVGSFDVTMRGWINRTFQADLYISSDGAQTASTKSRISPATWQKLVANPAIQRANVIQVVEIKPGGISTLLVGNELAFFRDVAHPAWLSAPTDDTVFDPAHNEDLALASESFSDRFRVRRGDQITIPTPMGPRTLTIAGVFMDYGNERGSLLVERQHFAKWFGNELAASVILSLKPGESPESVQAELRTANPGLGVFTSGYLRGEALRIFHQTFAVTYALELIGIIVAVVGLGFTLASLLWERRADLATLRALGLRRPELALAAAWEGALTAGAGLVLGLAVSLALGWLLIHRINKQTFGWTLQTEHPWWQLAVLAMLVLLSAVVTSWFVGRWAARLPAEREE